MPTKKDMEEGRNIRRGSASPQRHQHERSLVSKHGGWKRKLESEAFHQHKQGCALLLLNHFRALNNISLLTYDRDLSEWWKFQKWEACLDLDKWSRLSVVMHSQTMCLFPKLRYASLKGTRKYSGLLKGVCCEWQSC
ncbi:hypothetical protein SELMODRAFT_416417 [Selaginella moellendorffii]|uniref:Uncharacterized protein n=1 Tax=Selaginella moellendorffii TaxID=88036 RepID=D8RZ79_SELML|nr:hypothetical protein SELMODRAFT_416417 [Selaginella moellendorffii]